MLLQMNPGQINPGKLFTVISWFLLMPVLRTRDHTELAALSVDRFLGTIHCQTPSHRDVVISVKTLQSESANESIRSTSLPTIFFFFFLARLGGGLKLNVLCALWESLQVKFQSSCCGPFLFKLAGILTQNENITLFFFNDAVNLHQECVHM